MARQISLRVNEQSIDLDYFTSSFVEHTVVGMLGALKGVGQIDDLSLSVSAGQVNIKLNNAQLPTNEFVSQIIHNTVTGMVSTLKGVSKIDSLRIDIKR